MALRLQLVVLNLIDFVQNISLFCILSIVKMKHVNNVYAWSTYQAISMLIYAPWQF